MTVRTTVVVGVTAVALATGLAAPAMAAGTDTAPATAVAGSDSHEATRQAVRAAVKDGVPGVTLTARNGRSSWSTTAGVGNLRTHAPRSADDRYRVGSITKTFVSTVEAGSATQAATRLHVTQPVLSRQLRQLEQELGMAWFERQGHRLRRTAGRESPHSPATDRSR